MLHNGFMPLIHHGKWKGVADNGQTRLACISINYAERGVCVWLSMKQSWLTEAPATHTSLNNDKFPFLEQYSNNFFELSSSQFFFFPPEQSWWWREDGNSGELMLCEDVS